ncbi:MAG: polysaccharide deacetylase family protein [Deltaproteobacteria bacterium]|nr:polysaccharide deacetylase family protein [Deltaproteobacteria bacterium]
MAKDREYVVVLAGPDDTLRSLAARHLGDASRGWLIADFNSIDRVAPGQEIVIPLTFENPTGVGVDGYQTVPILCYHRFGDKPAKMVVTPKAFADQMDFLAQNGYRVVPMVDIADFLQGKRALPQRAVAITMDDGYKSAYSVAYPILKQHGFQATLYVYTDFVGTSEGLTWAQLSELATSGVIDVQPHSKSHANLAQALPGEDLDAYRQRITDEVEVPRRLLAEHLKIPIHTFAFPYGNANDLVVEVVQKEDYRIAATVLRGGNPFFAYPYLLRRTMIFGEDDLDAFRGKLEVFRSQRLR